MRTNLESPPITVKDLSKVSLRCILHMYIQTAHQRSLRVEIQTVGLDPHLQLVCLQGFLFQICVRDGLDLIAHPDLCICHIGSLC